MSVFATLSINESALTGLPVPTHGVTYHQQDNHGAQLYCGAAAAQIVLASIGAGMIDQTTLYASNQAHGAVDPGIAWDSPPDGLTTTLNTFKPAGFSPAFTLWDLTSIDAISRKICWAIRGHGVAPIVLVEGGGHWVVVVGYAATGHPTSAADTTYQIEAFDIYNPWPPVPLMGSVPPHSADDSDQCGSGYATGYDRGDQYKTLLYQPGSTITESEYWRDDYMTRVVGGKWDGKYLAICDPDPPAATVFTPLPFHDGLITDLDLIQSRASHGFAAVGQSQRAPVNQALDGTHAGAPLLVEREDRDPPRFYYLVPFRRDNGDVPLVATTSAYAEGGLASLDFAAEGTTPFKDALDRAAVIERFAGQQVEVNGSMVTLREEDLYPRLVWRPCGESLSRTYPFYRFDVGGQGSDVHVYVRIDGTLFTELTTKLGM